MLVARGRAALNMFGNSWGRAFGSAETSVTSTVLTRLSVSPMGGKPL